MSILLISCLINSVKNPGKGGGGGCDVTLFGSSLTELVFPLKKPVEYIVSFPSFRRGVLSLRLRRSRDKEGVD